MSRLLDAALGYAHLGYPVFPLDQEKRPRIPKRDGGNGFHDATTDPAKIREWWTKYPNSAGIGIPTGGGTFDVVDVDPRNGGTESYVDLAAGHDDIDRVKQHTGSGGFHLLFKPTGLGCMTDVRPGIDVKGNGGYIVVPPSLHPSGNRYQWDPKGRIDEVELPEMPEWLLGILQEHRRNGGNNGKAPPLSETIPRGSRNDALASLAGTMRRRSASQQAITVALCEMNRTQCDPPLPDEEVRKIAESISRYAPDDWAPPVGSVIEELPPEEPKQKEPYVFKSAFAENHYVSRYISYAAERTDAAHEYHEAVALAQLSAVTYNFRARLGPYPNGLATNLYILLLGDSTVSRKSTAAGLGRSILNEVIPSALISDQSSPEGFVEQLSARSNLSSYWDVDEFSDQLDRIHHQKFMSGFRGLLLKIYGGDSHRYSRHSKRKTKGEPEPDQDYIENPHLSIVGAATPSIFDTLDETDVQSGLLPRFAIIMPNNKPKRLPFYEVRNAAEDVKDELVRALDRIHIWCNKTNPKVEIDDSAFKCIDEFAEEIEAVSSKPLPETAKLMFQRLTPMAIKVAMLSAAGDPETLEGDVLRVTVSDAKQGIKVLRRWYGFAEAFAQRIGETAFERHVTRCSEIAQKAGGKGVGRRIIARATKLSKRLLDDVQATLVDRDLIIVMEHKPETGRPATYWRWIS